MQRIRKISESLTGGNPQNNPPPPRPAIGRPQKLQKRGRRLSDAAADVVTSVRNTFTRTGSDSFLGEQARNKLRRKSSDSVLGQPSRPGSGLRRTPSIQRCQRVVSRDQPIDRQKIGSPEPVRAPREDDWEATLDKMAQHDLQIRQRKRSQDTPPPRHRKVSQNLAVTAASNSKLGPVADCRPLDRAATRKPGAPREPFNVSTSLLGPSALPSRAEKALESPTDFVYMLPPNPETAGTSLQRKSRLRTQQREITEHTTIECRTPEPTRATEVPVRATTPLGRHSVSNRRMFAPSASRSSGHARHSPPKVEEVDAFKRFPSAEPSAPSMSRQTSHPPPPFNHASSSRHASSYVPQQPRPEPRQRSATAPAPTEPRIRPERAVGADPWDATKDARLYAWLDDTTPRLPGAPPPVPPKTAIYNPFVSRTRSVYSTSSVASPSERAAPVPTIHTAHRAGARPVVEHAADPRALAAARAAERESMHRAAVERDSLYTEVDGVEYVRERTPAPKAVRELRRGDTHGGSTRSNGSSARTDSYHTAVEGEAHGHARARR
ncbi:hypothetical protein PsYK624_110940 [Phanerochaete sordida]|uniref:Uncharacterized protein n=1 Tax=Phanerochaete sordida TaxID=48140 RepID=A0A9P3LHF5_9APHY|nr:hypothetical protein PsYK624_110940 [Phanerochaete sordida]